MEIDILIDAPEWEAAGIEAVAARAIPATLEALDLVPERFSVSILACDDARIAELNGEFRGKAQPTNVLSWPAEAIDLPLGKWPNLPTPDPDGPPHELGDIAIAYGVVAAEAEAGGKPLDHHMTHLLVHGTLHLLGFDHMTEPDAGQMEEIETRILARLGIPDPY